MSLYNVEAEWHMELKNKNGEYFGHRVKVLILDADLGFYINGMVVCPPNGKNDWAVFTPKAGNARIIEFNGKESKLWPEIKEACIDAVKEHLRHEKLDVVDGMKQYDGLSQEEFDNKLREDLDRIGF